MKTLFATLLVLGMVATPIAYGSLAGKQELLQTGKTHLTDIELQTMVRDYPLHVPSGSVERAFAR